MKLQEIQLKLQFKQFKLMFLQNVLTKGPKLQEVKTVKTQEIHSDEN